MRLAILRLRIILIQVVVSASGSDMGEMLRFGDHCLQSHTQTRRMHHNHNRCPPQQSLVFHSLEIKTLDWMIFENTVVDASNCIVCKKQTGLTLHCNARHTCLPLIATCVTLTTPLKVITRTDICAMDMQISSVSTTDGIQHRGSVQQQKMWLL
jgi:hypothetical protein